MEVIGITSIAVIVLSVAVILILKALKVKLSPFLIVAIVDIVLGLALVGFAIYDFHTSVGEFAGIFGQIALYICEPVIAVILIADWIAWLMFRKKKV